MLAYADGLTDEIGSLTDSAVTLSADADGCIAFVVTLSAFADALTDDVS